MPARASPLPKVPRRAGGSRSHWPPGARYRDDEMNQPTLLITLTGRDRPGVTSRLFGALAHFPLSVADIEQVTIRGRLVLGVLVSCDEPPDLTAIHRAITDLATDPGGEAETTPSSPEPPSRAGSAGVRGRMHVTVLGSPLQPSAIAAVAGRIAA